MSLILFFNSRFSWVKRFISLFIAVILSKLSSLFEYLVFDSDSDNEADVADITPCSSSTRWVVKVDWVTAESTVSTVHIFFVFHFFSKYEHSDPHQLFRHMYVQGFEMEPSLDYFGPLKPMVSLPL